MLRVLVLAFAESHECMATLTPGSLPDTDSNAQFDQRRTWRNERHRTVPPADNARPAAQTNASHD